VTADSQVAWLDPASKPLPSWATTALLPTDLYSLAQLARATGWSVVLTLNLAHFDPAAAADEARVARLALGSSLRAIAIGNEPAAFVQEHLRRGRYPFSLYRRQIAVYRSAIAETVPGLALYGPDNQPRATGRRNLAWAHGEARRIRPALLTGHLYGASKCSAVPPTPPFLLSQHVHRREERALGELSNVARRYGTAVWLAETNNVSCRGQPGVSNTYSTALWALDLLTRILRSPFVGAAFHGFVQQPAGYSPIAALSPAELQQGMLSAQPEWYALLLAHELQGDRRLPVKLGDGGLNVAAWAGRTPRGDLHVLIENEQRTSLSVGLPNRTGARSASILELAAPSLTATEGVTLGGASVATDGTWARPAPLPHAVPSHGSFEIAVAPMSAVLITTER
jgi:hypothetical protein